jgi:hypothetical protein
MKTLFKNLKIFAFLALKNQTLKCQDSKSNFVSN